jgi:ribosome recycling factor
MDTLKRMEREGDISQDEHHEQADVVQKLTDEIIARIGETMESKEQDVLRV